MDTFRDAVPSEERLKGSSKRRRTDTNYSVEVSSCFVHDHDDRVSQMSEDVHDKRDSYPLAKELKLARDEERNADSPFLDSPKTPTPRASPETVTPVSEGGSIEESCGPVKLRAQKPTIQLASTAVHRATAFDTGDVFTVPSEHEVKFMINPNYMSKQRFINHTMRSILVDWLVEVSQEYRLHAQTLFLAVSYVDRFLSVMSIQRCKIQLVGVTALLLASKYEDIYPPEIEDLVFITDNTYTSEQILKMEHLMLKTLKFNMGGVTPYSYYQRFMLLTNADDFVQRMTLYLMELTLQDGENFLQYLPSTITASALIVAKHLAGVSCWDEPLKQSLGLCASLLKDCVAHVFNTFADAANRPQQAVHTKYASCSVVGLMVVIPTVPPILCDLKTTM